MYEPEKPRETPTAFDFRDYTSADYPACEALVEQAWGFSNVFQHAALSAWALRLYTLGSLLGSDFRKVIEVDGRVAGFLFGRNERQHPSESSFQRWSTSAGFLGRLLLLRGVSLPRKLALLRLLNQHEIARSRVERRGTSEINLFVIDQRFHRHRLGTRMIESFAVHCTASGVSRIIVEVNVAQAARFYEKCGFVRVGGFESPLHGLAADPHAALYAKRLFPTRETGARD